MSQSKFKKGDVVIITHSHVPFRDTLTVLGVVIEGEKDDGERGIRIDTIVKYDPENFDRHAPGWWPTDGAYYIERCGGFVYFQ